MGRRERERMKEMDSQSQNYVPGRWNESSPYELEKSYNKCEPLPKY